MAVRTDAMSLLKLARAAQDHWHEEEAIGAVDVGRVPRARTPVRVLP